ncbi:hypothetical protein BDV40DRAFT_71147 [Aspergillus tamarii]|uniref:Uncharacterized protein n=1 Tax=Aspergillus tamarii TaxID=41984 RepID=A0A5N6V339_ASPTM|nr:hypothetical protein BDV40DRAFT_71147 [Aspergillus tamarii]
MPHWASIGQHRHRFQRAAIQQLCSCFLVVCLWYVGDNSILVCLNHTCLHSQSTSHLARRFTNQWFVSVSALSPLQPLYASGLAFCQAPFLEAASSLCCPLQPVFSLRVPDFEPLPPFPPRLS